MHGGTLDAGAIAGVSTLQSLIALSRAVLEDSRHAMFAGAGAEAFAMEQGFDPVPPEYCATKRRRRALKAYRAIEQARLEPEADHKFGTVGVVVPDQAGTLVTGTSSGGINGERWGESVTRP